MKLLSYTIGAAELGEHFEQLSDAGIKRARTAGLRAGIRVIVNAQKSFAPSRELRAAIGSRMLRGGAGAKAGGGVGKRGRRGEKAALRSGRHHGGVGISAANIHWYALGTQERHTGSRSYRVKGGRRTRQTESAVHSTGRMPANNFIRQATLFAEDDAREVLEEKLREAIEREWEKLHGGGGGG